MRYFNLMKSARFPDRCLEEAPRIGLPFILLPLAGYAQMTVTADLGTSCLRRQGGPRCPDQGILSLNLNTA